MASATPALPSRTRSRFRSFVWPREHGAWGMLLVPVVTGTVIGHPSGDRIIWILLFAVVALGLFCLRTPVEAWLQISPLRPQNDVELRLVHYSIYAYVSFAGLALAVLLFRAHAYGLLLLGAAAATTFLLQAVLKQLGRESRMNAQMTGAIALTSTAAGAYYLAVGRFDRTALLLWAANWVFAANQIHFVQLRIHSSHVTTPAEKLIRGRSFLVHQVVALFLLGMAWRAGWLPGLALVAFGPVFFRGFAWFLKSPAALKVHRLGISELAYAVVFGGLFIVGYHVQFG
jgi:YwiC-like protein